MSNVAVKCPWGIVITANGDRVGAGFGGAGDTVSVTVITGITSRYALVS